MKKNISLVFFLALLWLLPACSGTRNLNTGSRDGLSFETAVVVSSVPEEYEWVRKNYPEYRVSMQSLVFNRKKPYDILNIVSGKGDKKDIYFDISLFYGKIF